MGGFNNGRTAYCNKECLEDQSPRECLKNAFLEMYVTICGKFVPNEGGVAGCVDRMRAKYTAKWGVQLAGMIFQTRSSFILSTHALWVYFTESIFQTHSREFMKNLFYDLHFINKAYLTTNLQNEAGKLTQI